MIIRNRHTNEALYTSAKITLRETLIEAVSKRANLRYADLRDADLYGANLRYAHLRDANLRDADLSGADLRYAHLRDANLRDANLRYADLRDADLYGANLRDADLRYADLRGADLGDANLRNTILDPTAQISLLDKKTLTDAGFEIDGDYVIGWRTAKSQHVGSTVYEVGKEYIAPHFSVCDQTDCHPGIYLAGKEWLEQRYPDVKLVRVRCLRAEIVKAGDKFRARRVEVIG